MTSNRYYYNIYGYNNNILYKQSVKYINIRHHMYNILLYLPMFFFCIYLYLLYTYTINLVDRNLDY